MTDEENIEFQAREIVLMLPRDVDKAIAVLDRAAEILERATQIFGAEQSRAIH